MATEQMLPPEMPLPPEQPMGDALPPEQPMEEAPIDDGLIQSDALQNDSLANDAAIKVITDAKKNMYGEGFDDCMKVLQNSANIVEDIAMLAVNSITPSLNAVDSLGMGVPFDQIADVSAEVVSELYDMGVQTGTYAPSSEEEIERNQNISLTMVMGELGKAFGQGGNIPTDKVEMFIDNVMDGNYDGYDGNDMAMAPQGMPPMAPEAMPPQMGMAPEMPPQEVPPQMAPQEAGLITEEIV